MEEAAQSQRQAILDAALAELVARGIDEFTVEGVAKRAGVDPRVIIQMWGDRRVLLLDAQLSRAHLRVPTPDTGSLRGDALAVAASLAEQTQSPQWRGWFQRLLPASRDADLSEVRSDFWHVRFNDFAPVLQRAAERGELRKGIDPMEAVRMFFSAYLFDVIFADTPVRPEYAAQVLDIFIHGITR
ncbi:MAG: TetR/AcrR family transcriptional regulator [Mycobacterium sp.]|uniref:TetR/AcrR family transcriptional regulator n=1 Tax=Mycobacterium sp. TaxID=1785 RepID=UPI003F94E67A